MPEEPSSSSLSSEPGSVLFDKAGKLRRGTLLYTKEGDLDLGWVLLVTAFLNGILFFDLAALGLASISTQGWVWYGSLITLSFVAGVSIAKARLIAKVGVAEAQASSSEEVSWETSTKHSSSSGEVKADGTQGI